MQESLACVPAGEWKQRPWAVLPENPKFRWYFAGSVCSDAGTWVQNTAQLLLAYHLTHSVLAVAFVTCAQFSSPLVLGPWSGVMADRFGGRRTLLYTEIASAVIAGWLAYLQFTRRLDKAWLVGGAIVIGLAFTFALPARNVTVRRLVRPGQTKAAYAMDSVSYNLGRAIAPPATVGLIAAFGFGWAFAANAASFLIFTAVLVAAGKGSNEPERRSRVRDGFLTAYREGRIMILLLMVVAVTVAADPILVLGPALASHVFGRSASWSGAFIAALGAGSVGGSLRRSKHTASLKLAAMALAALGTCMISFVLLPLFWLSVAAAAAAGATCLVANSVTRTLLAKEAGPEREARVMAVWAIAWAGSKPLASLMDGLLPGAIGRVAPAAISIKATGLLMAVPTLIPILVLVFWPEFGHRLGRSRDDVVRVSSPAPARRPDASVAGVPRLGNPSQDTVFLPPSYLPDAFTPAPGTALINTTNLADGSQARPDAVSRRTDSNVTTGRICGILGTRGTADSTTAKSRPRRQWRTFAAPGERSCCT